jgi:hypothetical protein
MYDSAKMSPLASKATRPFLSSPPPRKPKEIPVGTVDGTVQLFTEKRVEERRPTAR